MVKRILILDNDTSVLDGLAQLLNFEGFKSFILKETDDPVRLVRLCHLTLILLDCALHGKNGDGWCAQLKTDPEFAAIPVIIYTAYCNKGIQKGTHGCDDFIAKPFDLDHMISRINALIEVMPIHCLLEAGTQPAVEDRQEFRTL